MIIMSSSVTSHVIDNIANDKYDVAVLAWKDELSRHLQVNDNFE